MAADVETPAWVTDRLDGIKGMLIHQFCWPDDLNIGHVQEEGRLLHGFWAATPEYEENGQPIGVHRLTVQHPANCECEI